MHWGIFFMGRYSRLLIGAALLIVLLLAACSNSENEEQKETENSPQEDTVTNAEEKEDAAASAEEASNVENQAPEDQGDLEVRLEGEIHVADKVVSVEGATNLLPESQLILLVSSEEGVLIGTNDRTQVDENGVFELESTLPEEVEGLLHIEVKFEPANQNEEIKNHYVNEISGSFVRNYAEADETHQKASFQQTVTLEDNDQTFAIVEPHWEVPDDYGEETVRLEPAVEKQDDYIAVKINSNILDGTFIQARADIPNYITSGIQGHSYTNPDGSAVLYVENPEKESRIKDLTEYEIVITMDPAHSNNGPHVTDVYGESGENLAGDFVQTENDTNIIRETVTVTVEE